MRRTTAIRGPGTWPCRVAGSKTTTPTWWRRRSRETQEETGIDLGRDALLAPLDEIHPRSAHLPSIGVTPYVGWMDERPEIRENHEIAGHIWVPLPVLRAPESRSTLTLPGRPGRVFPTIEYAGTVIWGLTHAIVEDFLRRVVDR